MVKFKSKGKYTDREKYWFFAGNLVVRQKNDMKSIMACVAWYTCAEIVSGERTISASNSLRFNVTQSVSWEQRAWKSGNQVNNVIMAEHTNEWSKLYLALFIWSFSTVNILIQVINLRIKYWILCQNAVSSENFLTLPTLRPEYDMHQLHYHTLHLRNCLLHLKSKDYFPIVMWESKRISSMYRLCRE